jgi:probable phosphoglycerate mutase
MTRLLLIRHGYSSGNKDRRFSGQIDLPLSEEGIRQAELVCDYIRENYTVDTIYSSDLERAIDTVKPLSEALSLPINIHRELREINEGIWQGMLITEVEAKWPEEFAFYKANLGLHQFEGGECYASLLARLLPMIDKIVADNEGKTVVIGTHGAVVRSLLSVWQGVPLERLLEVPRVPNGTVTEVEIDGDVVRVLKIGFADFLSRKTGVNGVD